MIPWIIAAILLASLFSWKRTRVKIFAADSSDSFKNRKSNAHSSQNNVDGNKKLNSSSSDPASKKSTLFELGNATSIVKFLMGKDPTSSSPNRKTQKTDEKEGESEIESKQNCEKEWNLRDTFAAEEDMRNVKWINHVIATFLVSEGLQKQLEQKVNQALQDQIARLENSNPDLLRKSRVHFQIFQHHHIRREENGSSQVNGSTNSHNNHKNPLHQEILTSSETILKNILPFRFHKIQVVNQSSSTGFNNFPESPNQQDENSSTLMSSFRVSLELALGPTCAPSRSTNKRESDNPITNLIDKIFGEQKSSPSHDEEPKSTSTKNTSSNINAGAPTTFSNVSLDFSAQVGVGFGRFLPFAIRISDFWSSIIKLHLQIDIYPGDAKDNNNEGADSLSNSEAKKPNNDFDTSTSTTNQTVRNDIDEEQRLLFEDDDDEIPGTKKSTATGGAASSDYGSDRATTTTTNTNAKNQQRGGGTASQPSNVRNHGDEDDEQGDEEREKPPNIFPPNRVPLKAVVTGYIGELGDSEFELRTSLGGMSIDSSSPLIDQQHSSQNNNSSNNHHKLSLLDSFLTISLCDWAPIVLLIEKRLNDLIKKFIVVVKDDTKKSEGQEKNIADGDVKSNKKPLFKITVPLPSSAPEY